MVGRAFQPAVCSFPLSRGLLSESKHITATVACCLQSSGRVATIYILQVLLKISGSFRLFLELCLAYIPAPNWVELQRGTYAN
jgi:hypothetical protein